MAIDWSAVGVIRVGVGLIGQAVVKIFGRPVSTGDLYQTLTKLDKSIQHLTDGLDVVVRSLEQLQERVSKQWQRVDEHTVQLLDLDKQIGIMEAKCSLRHRGGTEDEEDS